MSVMNMKSYTNVITCTHVVLHNADYQVELMYRLDENIVIAK